MEKPIFKCLPVHVSKFQFSKVLDISEEELSLCRAKGYKVTVHQTLRIIPSPETQFKAACLQCVVGQLVYFF